MCKKTVEWTVRIANDGIELEIRYYNKKTYFAEVIFDGNIVYTGNNKKPVFPILSLINSMTPDEQVDFYCVFVFRVYSYCQYISCNKTEISNQSKENAYNVLAIAMECFEKISIFYKKNANTVLPLKRNKLENTPKLLQKLIDVGQVYLENGYYFLLESPQNFFYWCANNNHDEGNLWIKYISVEFVEHYIITNCDKSTLQKYYNNAK